VPECGKSLYKCESQVSTQIWDREKLTCNGWARFSTVIGGGRETCHTVSISAGRLLCANESRLVRSGWEKEAQRQVSVPNSTNWRGALLLANLNKPLGKEFLHCAPIYYSGVQVIWKDMGSRGGVMSLGYLVGQRKSREHPDRPRGNSCWNIEE
jgi:hypothetical protein